MQWTQRTLSMVLLLTCPAFLSMTGVADARIKPPTIEELINSADVIVIAKAESVQTTWSALWRRAAEIGLGSVGILVIGFLFWRKKWREALVVTFMFGLAIPMLEPPPGMNRKVAYLSISSTIVGPALPREMPLYYHNGFVCDLTSFDAGDEYLLFLKDLSPGCALSWHDYGQWTIENGTVQAERRTWRNAPPIPLNEFIDKIKEVRSRPKKSDAPEVSKSKP